MQNALTEKLARTRLSSLKKTAILLPLISLFALSSCAPLAAAATSGYAQGALQAASPVAIAGAVSPLAKGVTMVCGGITEPTGDYPGPGKGVFTEDVFGNLWWCASGAATKIAAIPAGAPGGQAYQYMAGVETKDGLVLVLSDTDNDGMWFCNGATSSGCGSTSQFTKFGVTDSPEGIAMDKELNVYVVMFHAHKIYKCTEASSYQTCSVYQKLSGTGSPRGLAMDSKGNTWVSDAACTGYVWNDGAIVNSSENFGDVWTIAVSTANPSKTLHVYLGLSHGCTSGNAGVYDLTDGQALPTNIQGFDLLFGLTTKLQYSAYNAGVVYSVKDTV